MFLNEFGWKIKRGGVYPYSVGTSHCGLSQTRSTECFQKVKLYCSSAVTFFFFQITANIYLKNTQTAMLQSDWTTAERVHLTP